MVVFFLQVSSLQADIAALRGDVAAAEEQQQSKQQELQRVQADLRVCQEAITEQETQRNVLGVERKYVRHHPSFPLPAPRWH